MTREYILLKLIEKFELQGFEILYSTNLFHGTIDSLDFLNYARLIEEIAMINNLSFDIKDFLYSECYCVDDIYLYLSNLK